MNMLTTLLTLVLILQLAEACPSNETVARLCKCESTFDGITLDCSMSHPGTALAVLRDNRVQLGLIQQLIIQNTSLVELTSNMFDGLFIKKLDLSFNKIRIIRDSALDGLEHVLESFILSGNKLEQLPSSALNRMSALLQLDLSNNSIGNLTGRDQLKNIPKLYDLNLSRNRIGRIHKTVFDDIKHSLQALNLGQNNLNVVPAAALRGFRQLLALHLHNNQITELSPLQFMNLPALNLMNLAGNNIASVHRQSFLNVPNLRMLYFSDNNISSIQPGQYRHFENLEMLDLTKNNIREIPKKCFADMTHLSQLYLGENHIKSIGSDAFANSSLVVLLLPDNKLTEIDGNMFRWMGKLQQFSLKRNKIVRIVQNAFYHMPSLVMMDLSYNQLATLPPACFLTQLNIFLIDLTGNQFLATPFDAFNNRVMTVVLKENPLVCTEGVHLLQNGIAMRLPNTDDSFCTGDSPSLSLGAVPSLMQETFGSHRNPVGPVPSGETRPIPPISKSLPPIYDPRNTLPPYFFTRRPTVFSTPTVRKNPTSFAGRREFFTNSEEKNRITTTTRTPLRGRVYPTRSTKHLPQRHTISHFPKTTSRPVFTTRRLSTAPTTVKTYPPTSTEVALATLPPGIITAPRPPKAGHPHIPSVRHQNGLVFSRSTLPPLVKTLPPGKKPFSDQFSFDEAEEEAKMSTESATTTIAVCLTVVVVVVIAVFVTLCVVRHKGGSNNGTLRSASYVASQTLRHKMNHARPVVVSDMQEINEMAQQGFEPRHSNHDTILREPGHVAWVYPAALVHPCAATRTNSSLLY